MAEESSTILVGVEESQASLAALRWGARLAGQLGHDLLLLHVPEAGAAASWPAVPRSESAIRPLPDLLEEDLGEMPGITVHREVATHGPPSRALVEAAADAQLLVLGRARRRVAQFPRPNSVTARVLDRSPCPVVLVPERLVLPDPAAG